MTKTKSVSKTKQKTESKEIQDLKTLLTLGKSVINDLPEDQESTHVINATLENLDNSIEGLTSLEDIDIHQKAQIQANAVFLSFLLHDLSDDDLEEDEELEDEDLDDEDLEDEDYAFEDEDNYEEEDEE